MTIVIVGVDGRPFGTTHSGAHVALFPIRLVAIPMIEYRTPALNPLSVQVNTVRLHDDTGVAPPSTLYALYVYEMIGRPAFGVEAAQ
jgi:hypothetical protein